MRRLLILPLLALLGVGVLPGATASTSDVNGPSCADITGARGFYGTDGSLTFRVQLADPACDFVTYTLNVYAQDGVTLLTSQSKLGTQGTVDAQGAGMPFISVPVPGAPQEICVTSTTSVGGGSHVFDTAPDTGCLPVSKGGGAGGLQITFA